jgi:hypothetical protein
VVVATPELRVATTTRKFPSNLRSFFDNLLEQPRATAAKLGGEGVQAGKYGADALGKIGSGAKHGLCYRSEPYPPFVNRPNRLVTNL